MKRQVMIGIFFGAFLSVWMSGVLISHAQQNDVTDASTEGHESLLEEDMEMKEGLKPTDKYKFYKDVTSIEDLEEDDIPEDLEVPGVKIVYKTPDSCKEFTLYLEQKAKRLAKLERELTQKEKTLERQEAQVKSLIAKYSDTEAKIKQVMQQDPTELGENPELAKMIKLYETISAEEAAARLRNLDLDLTLAILRGMKPKSLSRIMTAMDPKLSAALSSQLVRGF